MIELPSVVEWVLDHGRLIVGIIVAVGVFCIMVWGMYVMGEPNDDEEDK